MKIPMPPIIKKNHPDDIWINADDAQCQIVEWWRENIQSLFFNAITVTGDDNDETGWAFFYDKSDPNRDVKCHTHKGYVIGITEIQRGVSREELDEVQFNDPSVYYSYNNFQKMAEILKRVRNEGLR